VRSTPKVLPGDLSTSTRDKSFDNDLTLEIPPRKTQGRLWILLQVMCLRGLVVSEEHEAFRGRSFQQHRARSRLPTGVRSGQNHGIRLTKLGCYGVCQPPLKLHQRISIDVLCIEASQFVTTAKRCERGRVHPVILTADYR